MDFSLSDEQQDFVAAIRDFCQRECGTAEQREQLTAGYTEAHNADLAIQDEEQVNFKHAWADPESGMVFCLSEAPNAEAVQRIHERAGHPADNIYQVPVQA